MLQQPEYKITYQDSEGSTCSTIKKGTYTDKITKDELGQMLEGSWGGYFIKFENGEFIYSASTD